MKMSSLRSEPEKEPAIKVEGLVIEFAITKHREVLNTVRKVTKAKKTLESMRRVYEILIGESTEILGHKIVAVKRFAGHIHTTAEGISRMVEFRMEVVDVDKMVMLN